MDITDVTHFYNAPEVDIWNLVGQDVEARLIISIRREGFTAQLYRCGDGYTVQAVWNQFPVWLGSLDEAAELKRRLIAEAMLAACPGENEDRFWELLREDPGFVQLRFMPFPDLTGLQKRGRFPKITSVWIALDVIELLTRLRTIAALWEKGEETWYEEYGLLSPEKWRASVGDSSAVPAKPCAACGGRGVIWNENRSARCGCFACPEGVLSAWLFFGVDWQVDGLTSAL